MARTITIDPVTRLEGHARITLQLDDSGNLVAARFHVTELRGFELFCEGRPFSEMTILTARICGICPVSHLLCAARTGDKLLAVQPPPTARGLRRLLNLAQICQSHALSFFYLSSADVLLGWNDDPDRRGIFGLIAADPDLARAGIRLRQFGQGLIERLAGRRIHPSWVVPGGVRSAMGPATRAWILEHLPEARRTAALALDRYKTLLDGPLQRDAHRFGDLPSLFMALVGDDGRWECCEGALRIVDSQGLPVADGLSEDAMPSLIGEAVEPWTYLRFPYLRSHGYPDGHYRVGPLARLNVCRGMGSPWADREWAEFRQRAGTPVATCSFAYHHARLVEIVACLEGIALLVDDDSLCNGRVRARAALNANEAIGVSEAPRGTLFHHYVVDDDGLITRVNLIIATGQNNRAMNLALVAVARDELPWPLPQEAELPAQLLNRLEAAIRCYDPCLSCSTHAAGAMALHVQLRAADGRLLAERRRDGGP
jgi:NAD-reducing hydrogenase large subunit